MNRVRNLGIVLAIIMSLFLIFPQAAYAYIDPGTGSIIIQVLIGAVVSGLTLLGVYRTRVKTFLQKKFQTRKMGDEDK